jgi:hypothetical protein
MLRSTKSAGQTAVARVHAFSPTPAAAIPVPASADERVASRHIFDEDRVAAAESPAADGSALDQPTPALGPSTVARAPDRQAETPKRLAAEPALESTGAAALGTGAPSAPSPATAAREPIPAVPLPAPQLETAPQSAEASPVSTKPPMSVVDLSVEQLEAVAAGSKWPPQREDITSAALNETPGAQAKVQPTSLLPIPVSSAVSSQGGARIAPPAAGQSDAHVASRAAEAPAATPAQAREVVPIVTALADSRIDLSKAFSPGGDGDAPSSAKLRRLGAAQFDPPADMAKVRAATLWAGDISRAPSAEMPDEMSDHEPASPGRLRGPAPAPDPGRASETTLPPRWRSIFPFFSDPRCAP